MAEVADALQALLGLGHDGGEVGAGQMGLRAVALQGIHDMLSPKGMNA